MYAEDLVVDQLQKVGGMVSTEGQHSISHHEKDSMSKR